MYGATDAAATASAAEDKDEEDGDKNSINIRHQTAAAGTTTENRNHSETGSIGKSRNYSLATLALLCWTKMFWIYTKKFLRLFFPSHVFIKFLIAALIPALSDNLIPLFYVGQIPSQDALAIAGQFVFISVVLEVIQEGVVNSMFNFIGQNYKERRELSLQGLKICLAILICLGSALTAAIWAFPGEFVTFINTPGSIAAATERFLTISSFSFPLVLVSAALNNYMYISTSRWLIAAQLSQVLLTFLINFFLFGQQSGAPSLHWGLDELGYYKIIQAGANVINNLVFFHLIERISPIRFLFGIPFAGANLAANFKLLFQVSWGNFGDSAVRNFFYFMVTLKFINKLGETDAGAWNLLNTIIWGVFLIPAYSVANYVKVEIGHAALAANLKSSMSAVAKESAICLGLWLGVVGTFGTVFWPHLAEYFSSSNEQVQDLSATMFYQVGWIYIVFSYNNAMDSFFLGTGETKYVFYQSFFTNMIVYFIPWILYLVGVLEPTYWWVVGLYFAGMLVDFGLTAYFFKILWKKIPSYAEI